MTTAAAILADCTACSHDATVKLFDHPFWSVNFVDELHILGVVKDAHGGVVSGLYE